VRRSCLPHFGHHLIPLSRLGLFGWLQLGDDFAVAGNLERLAFGDLIEDGAGLVVELAGVQKCHAQTVTRWLLHVKNTPETSVHSA